MQVVENWSRVFGRVVAWTAAPDATVPGELVVRVERVEPVFAGEKPFPNLLADTAGTSLRVRVPAAAANMKVAPGSAITLDVRRGRDADTVFAHPDRINVSPKE